MLGLFLNFLRQAGNAVLPGGLSEDGDWEKMTSIDWEDVDTDGGSDWENWDAAADE
jgi:hypothetical protein|tara:strand:- start:75 stop:242 length:168 start_codon:yes stop_codon:yes gene_type:complete